MSRDKRENTLNALLQLGKIKISIPVALTGFLGYYRFTPHIELDTLYTLLGILLLSMGSSAFNQIQERHIDIRMKRTKNRPLPSGRMTLSEAIIAGILFTLAGCGLIYLTGSIPALLIGLLTMAWYNLIYTPLKRRTPYAVLPGAIIGALPPMIGWAAAGGSVFDREILFISFFLFIGQMPHFWLLLMKIGEEYAEAGLPVITQIFSKEQLRNISFIWIAAAAVTMVFFPASGIIVNDWLAFSMIGIIILFLIRMFILSFKGKIMANWKKSFLTVNLFYLFIILLLIADKFSQVQT